MYMAYAKYTNMLVYFALGNAKYWRRVHCPTPTPDARYFAFWWNIGLKGGTSDIQSLLFWDIVAPSNGVEVLACLLFSICYPHEKVQSVAFHFSLPSERPGLRGKGRILNYKKKGTYCGHFMSTMMK